MPKLTVFNIQGQECGSIDLPEMFDKDVNDAVMHQAVVMYQANKRQGNADTKIRSEISGGNKKPFRQKGTGRARQGSSRSPLMRHGGIVFGPHPRDYSYTLPQKVRAVALRESLNAKFKANALVCIDQMAVASGKTKDFAAILKNLKVSTGKVVALFDGCGEDVTRASRNLARVNIVRVLDVNALDVLKCNKVLATKSAMEKLLKRLQ
ncbi:MAG: 50S ribosomal protein L4 [Candidatus Omnitrophica bacterium]|nr:50S ribosomal protein L4 [Candidatus Omnitrophota bacterium]